ncbi:hypothetical protein MES4922_130054 [Mesorhizobium ventifaucium]|uniref:Uncharacterized protein n=1 Tax=Mesorhizobium ventifaucium TaxID=666020 RepID=A0ABN8JC03_9HYPH|nr:hypothetical protein MES4922_130054 [Mesorhizobium ventifaucium]
MPAPFERRTLRRRSQNDAMTWERITRLANDWLPKPRIPPGHYGKCALSERGETTRSMCGESALR